LENYKDQIHLQLVTNTVKAIIHYMQMICIYPLLIRILITFIKLFIRINHEKVVRLSEFLEFWMEEIIIWLGEELLPLL